MTVFAPAGYVTALGFDVQTPLGLLGGLSGTPFAVTWKFPITVPVVPAPVGIVAVPQRTSAETVKLAVVRREGQAG